VGCKSQPQQKKKKKAIRSKKMGFVEGTPHAGQIIKTESGNPKVRV
jgi:hypothetical protein